MSTYPASARFRFGGGRPGEVRHATDIPEGNAGKQGKFAASALDAETPALLREGAMEALGGQLDTSRGVLALRRQGATIPLPVNRMGH